ncbi:MAG: serine dehydratase subunit alpha family protein [Thermoguttaceae bacterium]|nr:serine dehydratase subunit alpha family protein [Thermoguttaceae bacterium]
MSPHDPLYSLYLEILRTELVPATGCTEPIAIAYAAAVVRQTLQALPDRVLVQASGNLIKNVKSVYVPNTDGQRGMEAAVAIGLIGGDASRELEVIASVEPTQKVQTAEYLARGVIAVEYLDSTHPFDLKLTVYKDDHSAMIHLQDSHTNIVELKKDGVDVLWSASDGKEPFELRDEKLLPTASCLLPYSHCGSQPTPLTDDAYDQLSVKAILDFAQSVDLAEVESIIQAQIDCNMAIAEEGLRNRYGANVGKTILNAYGDADVKVRARAYTAAGSDARMGGCNLPVVINSGSGNQGLTVSVPVIVYAKELNSSKEDLFRALILSNLTAIHIKSGMGRLSAYCGVVSAGCGAGAGIAYLHGGRYREIAHTVVNAIAILSGVVCDGAKASCAAKIASAVDVGILGFLMFQDEMQFRSGEGLVSAGIEATLHNIVRLGKDGMKETDKEIIQMMMERAQPNPDKGQ